MTTNAEYMRKYRAQNPDYRQKERQRYLNNKPKLEEKYYTDDNYRQQKIEYAKNRYRISKQTEISNPILSN